MNRILERLGHLRLCRNNTLFVLHCPDGTRRVADCLAAQGEVLRGIYFGSTAGGETATVRLSGYKMSKSVIEVLSELPHWHGTLDLSTCTWPQDKAHAEQLVDVCAPKTYSKVILVE